MKLYQLAVSALAAALLGGCASVASPSHGLLFTSVKGPVAPGISTATSKSGQSCATNILGLVSFGDASIDAAKRAASISNVTSVDHDSLEVLGLFAKFCTVVKGD